jgi:hypothetical protein
MPENSRLPVPHPSTGSVSPQQSGGWANTILMRYPRELRWQDAYRRSDEVRSKSCLSSVARWSTLASSRRTVAWRSSADSFSA